MTQDSRNSLLDPKYGPEDLALLDSMRSRLNVANALVNARLARGMSQADVAAAAGTTQSRVSALESVDGNPRLGTLDRIARVLGLAVDLVPR